MAEVKVNTGPELELRTAKLTKNVLKQMPIVTWQRVKHLLRSDTGGVCPDAMPTSPAPQKFLGWVHESVLGDSHWLIVDFGEGNYGRFSAMQETLKTVPQIYII